jgi:serine/threonine protein kinase
MELLGPSLAGIASRLPEGHFSLTYIPALTHEFLVILEQFHLKGYVHRDIKPANFVVRLRGRSPIVLIDFGCSKWYINANNGALLDQKDRGAAIGSPLYASPNSHAHQDLCRKDDLYSLMYSILDLSGFRLPWKGSNFGMDVAKSKLDNPLSALLAQIGPNFVEIGKHIEGLGFTSAPDYGLMKELCLRGVQPAPFAFEWMAIPPQNPKLTRIAERMKNDFDPTGFLLDLAPHLCEDVTGGCQVM